MSLPERGEMIIVGACHFDLSFPEKGEMTIMGVCHFDMSPPEKGEMIVMHNKPYVSPSKGGDNCHGPAPLRFVSP
jgi:hypothetical protein